MEVRTCEEYVLNKVAELENELSTAVCNLQEVSTQYTNDINKLDADVRSLLYSIDKIFSYYDISSFPYKNIIASVNYIRLKYYPEDKL